MPTASPLVESGFVMLPLLLLAAWSALARRHLSPGDFARLTVGLVGWAALWWALAASGRLANVEQRPPLFVLLPPSLFIGAVLLVRSRLGAQLAAAPLAWLVGLQAFRLPLELLMHRAADEGVMPRQMTFGAGGWNYDIVSGATALLLGLLLLRGDLPRALVLAWNALGLTLLVVIMAVGIASTPLFARFGTEPAQLNTFILHAPYVWLPAVLVGSALLGHLLVFRALLGSRPAP